MRVLSKRRSPAKYSLAAAPSATTLSWAISAVPTGLLLLHTISQDWRPGLSSGPYGTLVETDFETSSTAN
jgi:hypothetical protein